jgi:hypothetical protein
MQQIPLSPSQRYWMNKIIQTHFNEGWIDSEIYLISFSEEKFPQNPELKIVLERGMTKKSIISIG